MLNSSRTLEKSRQFLGLNCFPKIKSKIRMKINVATDLWWDTFTIMVISFWDTLRRFYRNWINFHKFIYSIVCLSNENTSVLIHHLTVTHLFVHLDWSTCCTIHRAQRSQFSKAFKSAAIAKNNSNEKRECVAHGAQGSTVPTEAAQRSAKKLSQHPMRSHARKNTKRQMSASPVEIGNKPQLIRQTKAISREEEEQKKSKKGPIRRNRHS